MKLKLIFSKEMKVKRMKIIINEINMSNFKESILIFRKIKKRKISSKKK